MHTHNSRVIIFVAIFIVQSIATNALMAQDFYLGLKVGSGWSNFSYDGTSAQPVDTEQKLNLALTYNYQFSQRYGLNIETGYSDRGVQINADDLDYNLNYIDIPLLLDYYPVKRLRLNIGPEITHLISANNKTNDGTNINILDRFDNRWAVNGIIGINYSLGFFLETGFRYHVPFGKVSQSDPFLNISQVKSKYLQLYLLFKIAN